MIRQELVLMLIMVLAGMLIMLLYDLLIVIRETVQRILLWNIIEDFVYWICAAIGTFYVIYRINEGIIRGYAIASLVVGAILFQWSIGGRLVIILIKCIYNIRKWHKERI